MANSGRGATLLPQAWAWAPDLSEIPTELGSWDSTGLPLLRLQAESKMKLCQTRPPRDSGLLSRAPSQAAGIDHQSYQLSPAEVPFLFFFFFNFLMFFYICVSGGGGGAGREGDRIRSRLQALSCQHRD